MRVCVCVCVSVRHCVYYLLFKSPFGSKDKRSRFEIDAVARNSLLVLFVPTADMNVKHLRVYLCLRARVAHAVDVRVCVCARAFNTAKYRNTNK